MSKIAAAGIFAVFAALVILAVEFILPQGIDWQGIYQALLTRLDSNRLLAVVLLIIYLSLSAWVLLASVRWIAEFATDIVASVKRAFGKGEVAEEQTLDNSLIIDSPKLKRPMVRIAETIFSVAIWAFFVYLFQTILTTFMWLFGMERIYYFHFSQAAIEGTYDAVLFTLYTAAFFITVLFAWAQWNYWRFGRLERRKQAALVDASEVASFFCLPLATIRRIQDAKITSVTPLPDGFDFRELKPGK